MAEQIKANYVELEQVASRFANQSQGVEEMLQKVQGSLSKLESGGWIGLGAEAFFEEMQSVLLPASQRLQDALEKSSQSTKQIIQKVQEAEREASSLFRVR